MATRAHTINSVNRLWQGAADVAMARHHRSAAIDALVEQYSHYKGMCSVYGRTAWCMLCDVVKGIFGESEGNAIMAAVYGNIKSRYKETSTRQCAQIEHNQWRVYHINQQLKALTAERALLLKQRAAWENDLSKTTHNDYDTARERTGAAVPDGVRQRHESLPRRNARGRKN